MIRSQEQVNELLNRYSENDDSNDLEKAMTIFEIADELSSVMVEANNLRDVDKINLYQDKIKALNDDLDAII